MSIVNSNAKILTCRNGAVDVKEVLATGLYNTDDFEKRVDELVEPEVLKPCCKASIGRGESPCCKRARTFTSDKSVVLLGSKKLTKNTRHTTRFGITSMLYKARRPFHPKRFYENVVERFFVMVSREGEGEDEDGGGGGEGEGEGGEPEDLGLPSDEEVASRRADRLATFGQLLRSKGFFWMGNSHDIVGVMGQAGDMLTLESVGRWNVLHPNAYLGSEEEKAFLRKDFDGPYGDRRQDLVFIGQGLDHKAIQKLLDDALLTDDEFAMGIDGWKAVFGDMLLDGQEEMGEEEEEEALMDGKAAE